MKIGAQLYTLRDFCRTPAELAETLKKVADIGYTTVQISGTCAYEPAWVAERLNETGLRCVITHFSPDKIKEDPAAVAVGHAVFGCRYIGIGCFPGHVNGIGKWRGFVSEFLPAARVIRENGGYLMYHNHAFEFAHAEPGVTYLQKLSEAFPAELMGFTLDTYWVQAGGGDPAAWLRRLTGRVPCIHLKDMIINGSEQRMAAVGSGNLNFDAILSAAEDAGSEYLLVEQDECYGEDPFAELKKSYRYLRSCGLT